MSILPFIAIGLAAGIASGLFGIGGGIIIVPALVYFLDFSQHRATGTSLAILLPPVGLAAVVEYYRSGSVDLKAAAVVAISLFAGAWFSAAWANKIAAPTLKLFFGVFVICVGLQTTISAWRMRSNNETPSTNDTQPE